MPSINMIAARREEKRRGERNSRKLLYGIVGESGAVAVLAVVLVGRIVVMQGQVGELNNKVAKLKPRVTLIQQLQNQTAALVPKVQTLDGAKADTLFWYGGFYAVTTSLPAQTWLTALGTGTAPSATAPTPGASSGADPTLNIAGVAMSQAAVGQAMLKMNQSHALDHVDLAFVQQQKIGTTDAVGFQMTVHLRPEAATVTAASKDANSKDAKTANAKGASHDANS